MPMSDGKTHWVGDGCTEPHGILCGFHWRDDKGAEHDCYLPRGHPTRCWCTCGVTYTARA